MKKRSKHNLSFYRPCTLQPGELYPVGCVEVLPGDSFDHSAAVLLRCSPLLAPVMHRATVRIHHFYVPNRIIWPVAENGGWEAFMTQSHDGTLDVPSVSFNDADIASNLARLYEALGCPIRKLSTAGDQLEVSQLPGRAYWTIWNEYYRDQDLQNEIDPTNFSTTDGIQRVCWRKDVFTAARTSPQLGSDVTLPIGVSAPVLIPSTDSVSYSGTGGGVLYNLGVRADNDPSDPAGLHVLDPPASMTGPASLVGSADLESATGVSVNQLREALALQRYAERLSQFGHRYPEVLLSLGVKSSDARLQRPEYLGGGKTMISFSEVLQTSNGSAGPDDTVGAMFGHGIAPARTKTYRRFFEEHGYVISLLSVVPEAVYSEAVPRHFFKGFSGGLPQSNEKLIDDYWQPELERIGQQPIFKKEVYPDGVAADNDIFGYQDRYYEYRHQPSQVSGAFYPGDTLDYFTWARSFASQPVLNASFVSCTPSDRIFADQTGADTLWCVVNHRLRARRLVTNKTIGRIF